jgi:hypothetical protein
LQLTSRPLTMISQPRSTLLDLPRPDSTYLDLA